MKIAILSILYLGSVQALYRDRTRAGSDSFPAASQTSDGGLEARVAGTWVPLHQERFPGHDAAPQQWQHPAGLAVPPPQIQLAAPLPIPPPPPPTRFVARLPYHPQPAPLPPPAPLPYHPQPAPLPPPPPPLAPLPPPIPPVPLPHPQPAPYFTPALPEQPFLPKDENRCPYLDPKLHHIPSPSNTCEPNTPGCLCQFAVSDKGPDGCPLTFESHCREGAYDNNKVYENGRRSYHGRPSPTIDTNRGPFCAKNVDPPRQRPNECDWQPSLDANGCTIDFTCRPKNAPFPTQPSYPTHIDVPGAASGYPPAPPTPETTWEQPGVQWAQPASVGGQWAQPSSAEAQWAQPAPGAGQWPQSPSTDRQWPQPSSQPAPLGQPGQWPPAPIGLPASPEGHFAQSAHQWAHPGGQWPTAGVVQATPTEHFAHLPRGGQWPSAAPGQPQALHWPQPGGQWSQATAGSLAQAGQWPLTAGGQSQWGAQPVAGGHRSWALLVLPPAQPTYFKKTKGNRRQNRRRP